MATQTKRGVAQVTGCPISFDVIVYPYPQSVKASHEFELEKVADVQGQECGWWTRNESINGDIAMKLVGDTSAHAQAAAAFLAPLAVVTISACQVSLWNTTWVLVNGSDIDIANTKVGDMTFKFKRFVDPTQNALFATTPA
jgi:hypothetical protein